MADDPLVEQLLEEIIATRATPEDVCAESPHLLDFVRDRWRTLRTVEAQVDALFPTPGAHLFDAAYRGANELPSIPGYRLESLLGRGGMGVVYRARHLKLNRPVALKMLLSGPFASADELARFLREAEAVAAVHHPNIVQVYDVGDLDGRPYFTMELVEAGTLAHQLASEPQAAEVAAAAIITLARAVHTAHESGIVHRDLKPSNILRAADGTLKISDFGLARRFDDRDGITLAGSRLGTPSYMAPEQAVSTAERTGPPADIYSLGAILYEMLTGRPPFRADTPAETERQLVANDPAPPSRLNSRIPRDLETICLTCLQKDPARRYAAASHLADDLLRFQRHEPITARRSGPVERAAKWTRRRPAAALLTIGSIIVAAGTLSGALWFASQRATSIREIDNDLRIAESFLQQSSWIEAAAALERARGRMDSKGPDELQARVERSAADLELVARLDAIRLSRTSVVDGLFDNKRNRRDAAKEYEGIFLTTGLGATSEAPDVVAHRIANSHIRDALVSAIDDWTSCVARDRESARHEWLLSVARLADPDNGGWRDRARDLSAWRDKTAVQELLRAAPPDHASANLLLSIGERADDIGIDVVPFMKRVQQAHPDDFWVNFSLGVTLRDIDPRDAARFFQAAVAARPASAVARAFLGATLGASGQLEDALSHLEQALAIDPALAVTHINLANALSLVNRRDEAVRHYEEALRIDPTSVSARSNLARMWIGEGRMNEAITLLRETLQQYPNHVNTRDNLGFALEKTGRVDEAIEHFTIAMKIDPTAANVHHNYAHALRSKGDFEGSIPHQRNAVRLAPNDANIARSLGLALKGAGRPDEALDAYRQALRIDPNLHDAHHGIGIILAERNMLVEATEHFRRALRQHPTSAIAQGALAQTLISRGQTAEAKVEAYRFLELVDKSQPLHAVARQLVDQAEAFVALEARLPAIMTRDESPADAREALQFATLCRNKRLHLAAARLYADALDAEPSLTAAPRSNLRYYAACCAAMAGASLAPEVSDAERRRWRDQSRRWLHAELDTLAERAKSAEPDAHARVRTTVARWKLDPDLAAVRDPLVLAAVAPAEREECISLWKRADDLLAAAGQTP